MLIKLIIDDVYYDISSIVKSEIQITEDISKELDLADFIIPVTKSNTITGLDLSVPIKPLTRVEITVDTDVYRYYVREDLSETISFVTPKLYAHKVSLIEPTKLLELKPIPDMSVTQPQGSYTLATSELDYDPADEVGGTYDLTDAVYNLVNFKNTTAPTDITIINEETLKLALTEYRLIFNLTLVTLSNQNRPNWDIRVKINGVTVLEENMQTIIGESFEEVNAIYTLNYTTSVVDELVTLEIKPNSDNQTATSTYAESTGLLITSKVEAVNSPVWYFDEVIDKALLSQKTYDINDTTAELEFTLNGDTRNIIAPYVVQELTLEKRTLWELLETLGDKIKAIPRLSKDTWNEITFDFIDTLNRTAFTNTYKTEERQQLVLDKYSNSIEINADNVIESIEDQAFKVEPYENGWMTLRSDSDGPNQLTDETVGLKLRSNIYRVKNVYAKGFTVVYSDASSDGPTTVWNIKDYVVEQQRWNAAPNVAYDSISDRNTVKIGKGNSLPYSKSGQRITGIGYRAPKPTSGSPVPDQAIYQVIASVAQQITGKTVTSVNGSQTLADLLNTQYRVEYIAYKKIRIRLYKHDARDFEIDTTLYSNESDKVNDNVRLGVYNQSLVNRSGNINKTEGGITKIYNDLPKVGNILNANDIITKTSITIKNNLYEYGILGYKNYSELSKFVGINSEYRQYQVSDKDIVERNLIYEDSISVGRVNKTATHSVLNANGLTILSNPLLGTTTNPVTYHVMRVRNDEYNPGDALWTTFDSESEGPVDVLSLGTTMGITITTKDNYSIDDISEEKEIGVTNKWYQNNYRYGDSFGQFDSARYELYVEGVANNSVVDGNKYPEYSSLPVSSKLLEIDVRVKKDAREAIFFTYQTNLYAMLESGVENFRVYNGISKFNGLAIQQLETDIVTVLLKDGYFPNIEEVNIEATRYTEASYTALQGLPSSGKISIAYDITVPITPNNELFTGWALIDKVSGELIYAAKENIQSSSIATSIYQDTIYIVADKTKGE